MEIPWQRVLPVLVSIAIIILVAILREYSKTLAAITATMPINVPLALWIIYAAEGQPAMMSFTEALLINIWPTIIFLIIAWLAARAGWGLLPILVAGYLGWGISLGLILFVRQVFYAP
ncbi:MAG: hypothetical protein HXY41_08025 [Chloroflexi bacterium]|nr:hypothetical protein [Chloroflexota bacterium]